jgi:hypothetical protein
MNRSPSPSGVAPAPIGPLLQAFFMDYMYSQKRASPRTVHSYRETLLSKTGSESVSWTG